MRKLASLLLTLLVLVSVLPTAVTAESSEPSVKLIVPEGRVPLDEPIEITLELSGLDETVERVVVGGPGFKISDGMGYTYKIEAKDLPAEAFGDGTYRKTLALVWSAGDALHDTVVSASLQGDGYGTIVENDDGGYTMHNPYSASYSVVHNGEYIAFSAVSEEDAAAKLEVVLWPWIVGGVSVALLATVGIVGIVYRLRKIKKSKTEIDT
ncbi:MAG: hypothetical protein IJX76_00560 [Clostridia bacterium]|nr:hypothetical protein [Clostridia bacterium]